MQETKLRKGTFQHVESEMFRYKETLKDIEEMKNLILHSSPEPNRTGGGRSNIPSDPTALTATLMITHRTIEEAEKVTKAIKGVYDQLPPEKQKLIEMRYWTKPQMLTWDGLAMKIGYSKRTLINWRNEIVYAIAQRIGWR